MPQRSRQFTDVTSRYLANFGSIESHLRKLLHVGPREDFGRMVEMCRQKSLFGARDCETLDRFRRVRNALSHDGIGTDVSPTEEAIGEIERFVTRLSGTPPVGVMFKRDVMTFRMQDRISEVVQSMRRKGFSQVPIYADGSFEGLLTTVTIARWLGSELETKGGVLDDATVADAMPHGQNPDNVRFVERDLPSLETPAIFQEALARGKPLDALLITQNGEATEDPIGIVTAVDLPKVLQNG